MYQIFAGLFTEGSSDIRFLESIVQNTLENIAFECRKEIEINTIPITIKKSGLSFVNQVLEASNIGFVEYGINLICVHTDADDISNKNAYNYKIIPATTALQQTDNAHYCKTLIPIVPIQEIEAWMLADKQLLKEEIGTNLSDEELGIHKHLETIGNPEEIIMNAIRSARANLPQKKRKDLTISDLYLPIGNGIALSKLDHLSSFQDFKERIRTAFRYLKLL